mgnify:CR=1 FL=1
MRTILPSPGAQGPGPMEVHGQAVIGLPGFREWRRSGFKMLPNLKKLRAKPLSPIAGCLAVLLMLIAYASPLRSGPDTDSHQSIDSGSIRITLLSRNGGRLSWSRASHRLIVFDRIRSGVWDLWMMDEWGKNQKCITCDRKALKWIDLQGKPVQPPRESIGQPAWHPDGEHIIIQVSSPDHRYACLAEHPGAGQCNELWLLAPGLQTAWQLTNVDEGNPEQGTLHPHFSFDGNKLCWTEMYEQARKSPLHQYAGSWRIHWADFDIRDQTGRPSLRNRKEHQPGIATVYECHGFNRQANALIFSSPFDERGGPERRDIFLMALDAPHSVTRLTRSSFNEHALFSPSEGRIVWMSKRENEGADWWEMLPDGSGKKQITRFNQKGSPEYRAFADGPHVTTDLSWASDGKSFVGTMQIPWRFGKGNPEVIVRIDFLE